MKSKFVIVLILEPGKHLFYVNSGHYTLDFERAFVFSSREVCLDIQKEEKDKFGVDVLITPLVEKSTFILGV